MVVLKNSNQSKRSLYNYNYFENYYSMIGIDLRKQQTLDAYPKAIQKVNFTGNLARQATVFSLLKKQKKKQFYVFHKELSRDSNFFALI